MKYVLITHLFGILDVGTFFYGLGQSKMLDKTKSLAWLISVSSIKLIEQLASSLQ